MFPILAAEVAQAPPHVLIDQPEWVRRPDGADLARVYPNQAMMRNVEGRATVLCQVTAKGSMTNCFVEDESPRGAAFGEAVLRLTPIFQMKTTTADGVSTVDQWVKLKIRFRLPGGPSETTSSELIGALACYGQVTNLADGDSVTTEMWQASLYWYAKIAQSVALNAGRPSQVESYAAEARLAAVQGRLTIPKGWELEPCLAKTAK